MKVDAYNDINAYLSRLSGNSVNTIEDVVEFNAKNSGTEGAEMGDVPAFPSGQVPTHCFSNCFAANEAG